MNFPERLINLIRNIYANAIFHPLINAIDIKEFNATSGIPQECNLSGVLFNIAMILVSAKLNYLPKG